MAKTERRTFGDREGSPAPSRHISGVNIECSASITHNILDEKMGDIQQAQMLTATVSSFKATLSIPIFSPIFYLMLLICSF